MDIDKYTITELFEKPRRFVVPLFQRPYVWGAEKQWQPLWEDIIAQVDAAALAKAQGRREPRPHFLGAVVLGREKTVMREVPRRLVVDGQQRLTTLQVLLAAFHSVIIPLEAPFLTQTLNRLLHNPEPLSDVFERFKIWPTQANQAAFQAALTAADTG